MCGRFVLASRFEKIKSLTHCHTGQTALQLHPSWNIAPADSVLSIYKKTDGTECTLMHWGFIPHWAKDKKIRPINARGESINDKPFFRSAFRHQRCLIFADGFYEWQPTEHGKQPWYIQLDDKQPFAMAGIWDRYQQQESMALITTAANALMQPIHARMPVIIAPQNWDTWLDAATPVNQLKALLRPIAADKMQAYPVSQDVNSPKNNFRALINRTDPRKSM